MLHTIKKRMCRKVATLEGRGWLTMFSVVLGMTALGFISGCASTIAWLPSTGPSGKAIQQSVMATPGTGIEVVDVTDEVARRLRATAKPESFAESFAQTEKISDPVNPGDILEISVWEAPPALLFGAALADPRSGPTTSRVSVLPEQMVTRDGTISVPFAGRLKVSGRSLDEIGVEIARRLEGKANQPQVLVRMLRNNTANVTVVGEVAGSTRMPLTPKGERLLDALAAAGGVRQPVNKMTLQVTRGEKVRAMSLDEVIRDPRQNIFLHPGDVVTALFQPLSFSALGATGKNEEVPFEAQGISLAQALARVGGLQDSRADARGVFVFRFENRTALDWADKSPITTPEGRVPVVYRLDLKNPSSFFVSQGFPVRDQDVLYVSNAPAAELQKFLNLISTVVYPALGVINSTK